MNELGWSIIRLYEATPKTELARLNRTGGRRSRCARMRARSLPHSRASSLLRSLVVLPGSLQPLEVLHPAHVAVFADSRRTLGSRGSAHARGPGSSHRASLPRSARPPHPWWAWSTWKRNRYRSVKSASGLHEVLD